MRVSLGFLVATGLFTTVAYFALRPLWSTLRTRRGTVGYWAAAAAALSIGLVPGAVPAAALIAWAVAVFSAAVIAVLLVHPVRGVQAVGRRAWAARAPRAAPRAPSEPSVPGPLNPARRTFLKEVTLPTVAMSAGLAGAASGARPFDVREEEIRIEGLPAALDGFRIGQLTDVHVGEFIDVGYLRAAVAALDEARVDLQVMTGDLIDDLDQLEPTLDALEATSAEHGMVAILGNHEKWRSEARVVAGYARRAARGRLRLLVDQNLALTHRGATLRVTGVDYPMGRRGSHRLPRPERRRRMEQMSDAAFAGVRPGETVLCLAHHPDFFPLVAERGAHLTLAGHTHGGQVGFFRIPLFFFAFEHMVGLYRAGKSALYVSAGTGHWLPFRLGMPAEVTVITLRSAQARA